MVVHQISQHWGNWKRESEEPNQAEVKKAKSINTLDL
jgi:hypothetical protein